MPFLRMMHGYFPATACLAASSSVSTPGERFETHGRRAPGSYLELTAKSGPG